MNDFDAQFEWQAKYANQVVRIIAPYLIKVADPEVDKKENGDFQISFPRNGTVGCRLRKPDMARYVGEVTFRSRARNGGKTEITKIIDGYGDYFFYGHVNNASVIWHWYLIDYTKLRALFIRRRELIDHAKANQVTNRDGTKFIVFNVEEQLPEAVIAQSTARQEQLLPA